MKKMRQTLTLLLSVLLLCSFTACSDKSSVSDSIGSPSDDSDNTDRSSDHNNSGNTAGTEGGHDTLVIGISPLEGVFNPFFYQSSFDDEINSMIFSAVCLPGPDGTLQDSAGHVDLEEVTGGDGSTKYVYTVSVRKGMKFSDGEPITIDDVIFGYYVYADPTYDGMSTFSTLDIEGMKEYFYDTPDYSAILAELEKYKPEHISEEDFTAYIIESKANGWFDDTLPGDPAKDGSLTWADYVVNCGAATREEADAVTDPTEMLKLLAKAEFYTGKEDYDVVSYSQAKAVQGTLEDGVDVEEISGIRKVDDYTCTVTFLSPNISGDKQVAWHPIMPKHYYGANFSKGNLDGIRALNKEPLGSGPYIFQSFDNNIVSLRANPDYYKGEPKIPNLKYQVVNENDKIALVLSGEIDIASPAASIEAIEQLDAVSGKVKYTLVDSPGYGYIGINAERVPDINVRKGLMHLMNRAPAVSSYYGELGEVIERPMTPTLPEYPVDAEEYYGYDPKKALEYFKTAGYEQADGKLMKDGEQLILKVGIGEANNHPITPILTQMANDMETMGAQLIVNDMAFNNLSPAVKGGELDMWVMAWGNSNNCDLTQNFGSKGGSNYQRYYDSAIDGIQAEILKTMDLEKRCRLVATELDLIMDAAVYMPVYQRKNMEIYNAVTIKLDTLPEETTTFYNYARQIEKLEMN